MALPQIIPATKGGTGLTSYAIGDLIFCPIANTLGVIPDVATGSVLLSGGILTAPSYGKVGLSTHVSGTLPVANGGTNLTSYTIGDIVYASGATTLASLADIATGNALITGGVGAAPTYGKIGLTTHISGTLGVGNGGTGITTTPTNGQIPIGNGTNYTAATITAGTGANVSNGAGTITIDVIGGGVSWTEVTGTTQTLAVNSGFIANNAGLVTLTLPSSAALGTVIRIQGKGAGLWKIAQNASQTIHLGNVDSTAGVGGSVTATNRYDAIELLCITANTDFAVLSSTGSFTVV